ncbi:MAG: hypothetical protein M1820_004838 [Bogoriella megaspora]|nr:MAG: hypothetical protein M1820_004838 [Bogoriella megaspora]
MVNVHVAYTQPINPAGASPILTESQVWEGLERKVRFAQEFVGAIESTDVLEEKDEGKTVVRIAHFKPEFIAEKGAAKETCRLYKPTKVDFVRDNGAVITNTVSYGESLGETDLWMTYTFEYRDIEESKVVEMRKLYRDGAKGAVDSSIKSIREMVKDGRIK